MVDIGKIPTTGERFWRIAETQNLFNIQGVSVRESIYKLNVDINWDKVDIKGPVCISSMTD